jgi:CopG family nickel-responsive transcriptional regulator
VPIISISLPQSLLDKIDHYLHLLGFVNRSEFVREAVRRFLEGLELEQKTGRELHWILVVITEHGQSSTVDQKVIETIYSYQTIVKAFYHQLLKDNTCVNIAVVEASIEELQGLHKDLRRLRGIIRIWFIPIDS